MTNYLRQVLYMNNKAIEGPIMLHAYVMWDEKLLRMIDYSTRILGLMQRDVVATNNLQLFSKP